MKIFYTSSMPVKTLTATVCFTFFLMQIANAQSPVLTEDNFKLNAGDQFIFVECYTNNFDTATAGTNQLWDYSSLQDSLSGGLPVADQEKLVLASSSPYAADFPGATVAAQHPNSLTDDNDYYGNTNAFYYWGSETNTGSIIYSKPQAASPLYPVSYGSRYADSSNYIITAGQSISFTGTDSLNVTGYGTLKLPNQTITNVLKIRRISTHVTQIISGSQTKIKLVEYIYYTPGNGANLLNVQHLYDTVFLFGIPLSSFDNKRIYYQQNSILPLQLASFNVYAKDKNVLVQWQTAEEQNTSYFNVLRSNNGKSFSVIKTVNAAGNSSVAKNYSYTDAALLTSGKLYYQLQEVDKDGKSFYSSIQTVDFANAKTIFTVSPNPAKDHIDVKASNNLTNVQIIISDMNGKTLYAVQQNFSANQTVAIPVARFSKQLLIVTLKNDEVQQQFKIIKE